MKNRIVRIVLPAVLSVIAEQSFTDSKCFAITYLTVEEAKEALLPKALWEKLNISLTDEQIEQIEDMADANFIDTEIRAWRSSTGEFFIVDNVLGKHEYITYALLINSSGAVAGLEILDYREAYGGEIRRTEWRSQFISKNAASSLELNEDILNISGATISCLHVTKGVRRLLALHNLVLRNL